MNRKYRMSRETLLRQLGGISERYILEAADLPPAEQSKHTGRPYPGNGWWRHLCTSPAFAICLGLAVALAVVAAFVRLGNVGTTLPPPHGAHLSGSDAQSDSQSELIATEPVPDGCTALTGHIVKTSGGFLFAPDEDGVLRQGDFALLQNGFGQKHAVPDTLRTGDRVQVLGGYILESYPAQMPVYRVDVLEHGQPDDVNQQAMAAILRLSKNGLGWNVEYDPVPPNEPASFTGHIVKTSGWFLFLPDEEDGGMLRSGDFVILRDRLGTVPDTLQTGDRVRVWGGLLYYSYPAQMPVIRVEVLEHGQLSDVNQQALAAILSLQEKLQGMSVEYDSGYDSGS